jgi:uncharacterized protein (UPF0335 family)
VSEDVYDPYATGRDRMGKQLTPEATTYAGAPINGIASQQLRSIVERIERLEGEKKDIAEDIKGVYGEAKANGYDTKALRKIVALRKKDAGDREEEEAILELYKNALGMV